ncbi:MAG: tRNA lysidine(34) synthetase TilS [Candidatus Dactylopiibacterium carminicum]|nr:tRNA lysidine(34) synthetase TilS [Candidatus Dactylopiibacterium carminicum]PAT00908.1 MAG: tRNA lysidine(34) synthetase TilS [Candidatus Dactylopiibacterium carminicum]
MPDVDLENRLRPTLRDCAGLRLCVAYSGGLDSSVLLHLLARLAPEGGYVLSAIHVHHGLNARADAWAVHCARACAGLGIPLHIERVVVEPAGKGVEAAAREARHAAFVGQDVDWILLAHHADDQAETLLHRLMRGTGVAGAGAMRVRDASRRLWRPLLEVSRAELETWARAQGLGWIEDDSNENRRYTRNYLRHAVMPLLRERQPAVVQALGRAAAHFAESEDLLQVLARQDLATIDPGSPDSRAVLQALGGPRMRNVLRHWLAGCGAPIPSASRLALLCDALSGDGPVRQCFGEYAVCAYHRRLWLEPAILPEPMACAWSGEHELPWGVGRLRFESGAPGDHLQIRPRQGGEVMSLGAGRPRRPLKSLCQDAGLPAWWRAQLPLLYCGETLLWVGGLGFSAEALAKELSWRPSWLAPDGRWLD